MSWTFPCDHAASSPEAIDVYRCVTNISHYRQLPDTSHGSPHRNLGWVRWCLFFFFCGYTLNLLLVYIWILNDLDIDGKYISTYALERTRRGRVQRSSPLRCPERVLWNMVSRRGMPAAETIGADTIDVGLLSDLNTGRWFHDVSSMMPIFHIVQEGWNHRSDMPLSDPVSLRFVTGKHIGKRWGFFYDHIRDLSFVPSWGPSHVVGGLEHLDCFSIYWE